MTPPRVLLVGAGFTGRVVAQEYARTGRLQELIGFIDDAPALGGTTVEGVPVLGTVADLPGIVASHQVDDIIVTIPSLPGPRVREVLEVCRSSGVPVRTMPSILELLGQPLTSRLARPVHLADLLRRAHVDCDQPPEPYLRDATVLITGAGGSIGAELARQVARAAPARLVLVGHGENSIHDIRSQLQLTWPRLPTEPIIADVRDRGAMRRLFARVTPDVVFHAAAHKHVPLMENFADEAVRNNVLGTQVITETAAASNVPRLIFISTDKAVRPVSVMGATKRVAEWIVRDVAVTTARAYATVRFGNVLGSRGSLVPVLERQVARGGPITITDERMTRYFLTIPEAVFLVLKAGGLARSADLFVLDMGAPVRVVDLARDLVRLMGRQSDEIEVVFTGLRPGEKLSEDLWEPGSEVTRVAPDIFSVREPSRICSGPELREAVDRLERAATDGDAAGARQLLRDIAMATEPA